MAVLAASDVTFDLLPTIGVTYGGAAPMTEQVRYMGRYKESRVRMTFSATKALVWPSGDGLALPTTPGTYGFVRNVDNIKVDGYNHVGIVWSYNPSGNALQGFFQGPTTLAGVSELSQLPTTWAPSLASAAPIVYLTARGW